MAAIAPDADADMDWQEAYTFLGSELQRFSGGGGD
jgi:hypothetical protein